MWQAAIGVVIGYLFALWWIRRAAHREIEAADEIFRARLEASERNIVCLRNSFDKSQRALSAFERRNRYLEAALIAERARPPARADEALEAV